MERSGLQTGRACLRLEAAARQGGTRRLVAGIQERHVGDAAVERAGVTGDRETRLRRLRIRCWRRGTREMDLILGGFADAGLERLEPAELAAFEAMLSEDDHELYPWITGQAAAPAAFRELVGRIRRHHRIG